MWLSLLMMTTAQASHQPVDFRCSHDVGGEVIGVPPFELKCVADIGEDVQSYDAVEWAFGDGELVTGDAASHTYTEAGTYSVSATLLGAVMVSDEDLATVERKLGYVTACPIPDVDMTVYHYAGLTYDLLNYTDVGNHGCVSDLEWNIHEGDGTNGKVVAGPFDVWNVRVELPEEGTYTAVLNVGGIAGTAAAKLTFEAVDGLGEGLENGSYACASGPVASGWWALLALGLVRRR